MTMHDLIGARTAAAGRSAARADARGAASSGERPAPIPPKPVYCSQRRRSRRTAGSLFVIAWFVDVLTAFGGGTPGLEILAEYRLYPSSPGRRPVLSPNASRLTPTRSSIDRNRLHKGVPLSYLTCRPVLIVPAPRPPSRI